MKLFQKDTDYAVRLLIYLALHSATAKENPIQQPQNVSVQNLPLYSSVESDFISTTILAQELGLPLNFLRRICSTLIRAEVLEKHEGIKGGVRLVRSPQEITLREIIEHFHGQPEISECTFRKKLCPNRKTCVLRRRIVQIEEKLIAEFEAITIQTLIDDLNAI